MKVWAFEHTTCIYESAYGLVSLHASKQEAEKAKEKFIQGVKDRYEAKRAQLEKYGFGYDYDPLAGRASRIREVDVDGDASLQQPIEEDMVRCHYEYPVVDPTEESEAGMWPVLVPDGFKIVPVTEAGKVPEMEWRPIATAPKDNKRPLLIARFNDDGSMQSFDYDAIWKSESESWEIPEVYYYWASANGDVEEPTHWCYEPEGFSKLPAQAIEAMKEQS